MEIWRNMISQGVPVEHIVPQVEQHIEALEALDPSTTESTADEIDAAIEEAKAFLGELRNAA